MSEQLDKLGARLGEVRAEWEASARLRYGVWAVLGILCVYGLLLSLDAIDARKLRLQDVEAELLQAKSANADKGWPQRATEAEQQTVALAAMAWAEPEIGLSEAAFQDWLRNVSSRLGLKVKELAVSRSEEAARTAGGNAGQATMPPGAVLMRARLIVDLQRAPVMSFLAEVARNERSVVVERMTLRANSQPPQAEFELRALAKRTGDQP